MKNEDIFLEIVKQNPSIYQYVKFTAGTPYISAFDSNGKRIKFNVKKILAIAAAVAVLLVGTISASAIIFDVNLFDGIVEIYNDYIRINFDKTDNTVDNHQRLDTELTKELANNGFDTILLPEEIFSTDYELTDINYEADEYMNSANITLKYQDKLCNIDITQFSMEEIVPDVEFLNVTSEIKEIKNDNVTIYCFMQDKSAAITYRDGLSVYFIQIPMNLDKAIEVAETIK